MNSDSLSHRLEKLVYLLQPRDIRLPYVVIDPETGASWPGYELHNQEHEQLARRRGLSPKHYDFDPNEEEGIEP
jgi:hypothetical protein